MNYLFHSERLGFRNWVDADLEKIQDINSDEDVMEFFPSLYTIDQTSAFIKRMQDSIERKGYGYFAVDELSSGDFIGFIGVLDQNYDVSFMPAIDIGWRLDKTYWGKGHATEGAKECLNYAFQQLGLESIISVAPLLNIKSIGVMEKIGMTKRTEFEHPLIDKSSPLKICVCYQIAK